MVADDAMTPEEIAAAEAIHRESAPSAGALALSRLISHEKLCGLRYQQMIDRVVRLERVVMTAAGTLIIMMGGVIVTLTTRAIH